MARDCRQLKIGRHGAARPAFTMVEIIVVLMVVSVGLVGILALIVQNIQSQSYNKNNLIANHLAQEGIELIRKVRDSNWKAGQPFYTNLAAAASYGVTNQYYMDYRDAAPHTHNVATPAELILKQDANGWYFHDINSSATSTIFSRLITTQLVDANSLQVNAVVTWSDHNRNFSYALQTLLYDWR
jgi:type II secretory pathway pseudopilin PulG